MGRYGMQIRAKTVADIERALTTSRRTPGRLMAALISRPPRICRRWQPRPSGHLPAFWQHPSALRAPHLFEPSQQRL